MQKYKWVGNLYPDWFRQPASPLERTWRGPLLLRFAQHLIKEKLGLKAPDDYYIVKDGWLYIRTDWSRLLRQWQILFAPVRFFKKLLEEKKYFTDKILPEYINILELWRKESSGLSAKDNAALWQWAQGVMETDTKYAVAIAYVGVYGFLFDYLLGQFYSRFVRDEQTGYHALLAGFPNRTYELNVKLFELSQIDQAENTGFQDRFLQFLVEFGLEKSDWELALPVLGEHPQAIMHMIETYCSHPELDPRRRLSIAERERNRKLEYALNHLKFPFVTKPIFKWIVRWAQEYIPLRETRQHYIGAGTFFIRQALKVLESRLGFENALIFYLEKEEIEKAISGELDSVNLTRIAKERYKLRELQKQSSPEK